jgi:hypothetical protein
MWSKLMWGQPPSAVRGAKRRSVRVERTLLSVAFDLDLDLVGCHTFCRSCERWESRQ